MDKILKMIGFVIGLFYASQSNGQNYLLHNFINSPKPVPFILYQKMNADFSKNISTDKSLFLNDVAMNSKSLKTKPIESAIHYTSFFCKLECTIHKQTNVWIKFRTGNDDDYRKMIAP